MVTRGPQANRESDAWGAIGSSPQRSSRGSDSKCVFPSDAHKRPTSRARLLSRKSLRPRFDRRRVSEQIAATTVGCWTVRRRPRKHTSQQRLTVPAGRGKDSRDTAKRGNSGGTTPGLLQRAKNQPVVPSIVTPHSDAGPVPYPVLDTGSSPTPHSCHPRAAHLSSSSEAKDLPAIPQPHSPPTQPVFSQPVVPGQPGTHGGARDGRGYDLPLLTHNRHSRDQSCPPSSTRTPQPVSEVSRASLPPLLGGED